VELHISSFQHNLSQTKDLVLVVSKENPAIGTPPALVGRGFNILLFETKVLASRITALSGSAGVGKTAFIRNLLHCWEDTGLFEKSLYMDCSSIQTEEIHTPGALLHHLLGNPQDLSSPDIIEPEQTDYRSAIADLRDTYKIIVFDNLEASYSNVTEMNDYGRWPEDIRVSLVTLILDIISVNSKDEDKGTRFILVGRSNDRV
jgi:hypothetical protein